MLALKMSGVVGTETNLRRVGRGVTFQDLTLTAAVDEVIEAPRCVSCGWSGVAHLRVLQHGKVGGDRALTLRCTAYAGQTGSLRAVLGSCFL